MEATREGNMGLKAERSGGLRLDSSLPQASLKAGRPGDRGLADNRVTREARERLGGPRRSWQWS